MVSRRAQSFLAGFLTVGIWHHAACHCFNSRTVSTQGLCLVFKFPPWHTHTGVFKQHFKKKKTRENVRQKRGRSCVRTLIEPDNKIIKKLDIRKTTSKRKPWPVDRAKEREKDPVVKAGLRLQKINQKCHHRQGVWTRKSRSKSLKFFLFLFVQVDVRGRFLLALVLNLHLLVPQLQKMPRSIWRSQ